MPATYEPIATLTFNGTTSEGTFTSIPATFTDLKIVLVGTSTGQNISMQFNSDTSTNYSRTLLQGDGSSATSSRVSNENRFQIATFSTTPVFASVDIFSYAGSTFKSALTEESRDLNGSGAVVRAVGMWRSTSAITAIKIYGGNSNNITGTATLYGILKA